MFTTFLSDNGFLAGHWAIVLGVSLAFLFVQIVLCLAVYLRLREQNRILAELCRDFDEGGDGRGDSSWLPEHFTWLHWLFSIFPPGRPASAGNLARDDVFRELDVRIAGNSSYLLLQRMGVMAPLLGVVLTVISFFWLEIDEAEQQSLSSILLALTPLVSGVGAGAVLALVNQVLLQVVGRRIESLRLSAREWFDSVIWTQLPADVQAAKSNAVDAVEQFSLAMVRAADRYAAGAERIEGCTTSMMDASRQFHEIVQSFGSEIKGIPAALCDVRNATTASANALRDLIPVNARAVASLDVSVSAFRTTIDREFSAAAKLHQRSSKDLAGTIEQIGSAAERLKLGSIALQQTAESNSAFFERMKDSLGPYLAEPNRQLHEAARNLTAQMNDVSLAATALSQNVTAISNELASITGVLSPAISSLQGAIENQFGPTLAKQQKQAVSVGRSVRRLRTAADGLAEGTTTLNAMLNECSLFLDQARSTRESLADATTTLTDVARQLHGALNSTAVTLPAATQQAVNSLSEAAARLVGFVEQSLHPAASQLADLQARLSDLDMSAELAETVRSSSDGTAVTTALAADEHRAPRTWFSRRPR